MLIESGISEYRGTDIRTTKISAVNVGLMYYCLQIKKRLLHFNIAVAKMFRS